MRILLGECVDERLRHSLGDHDCQTARYAGLASVKNGELLSAAEAKGFDLLITVDQGIPAQQNFAGRHLALLILCAPSNRLRDLKLLIPAAVARLDFIKPGEVVFIRPPALRGSE